MRARRKHRLVPRPVRRNWLSTKATFHEVWIEGATLAAGGGEVKSKTPGHYFAPALFTDVSSQTAVARDEIFGPIAAVLRVPDYDAALSHGQRQRIRIVCWHRHAGYRQDRPFHAERRGRYDSGQSAHCRHGFSRTIYRPKRIILWRA